MSETVLIVILVLVALVLVANGALLLLVLRKKEDKTKDSDWEDNIANQMIHWSYTAEQKMVLTNAMEAKIPKAVILSFFYPENSAEEMSKVCRQYIEEH